MSAVVSNLASPVMFPGGDAARNIPSSAVGELAKNTQETSNTSKVVSSGKVDQIQGLSRTARLSPPEVDAKASEHSKEAQMLSGDELPGGLFHVSKLDVTV
ncbi:MAG: hypothetical protein HQL71_15335 [Magnetococcales bacterium]|nr:hypothetical protein [Magnetococcales bacterium]